MCHKKNIKKGKNVSVHFHSKDDDGGDDKKKCVLKARDSGMPDAGEGLFAKQFLRKVFISSFHFCISQKALHQTLLNNFFNLSLNLSPTTIFP